MTSRDIPRPRGRFRVVGTNEVRGEAWRETPTASKASSPERVFSAPTRLSSEHEAGGHLPGHEAAD